MNIKKKIVGVAAGAVLIGVIGSGPCWSPEPGWAAGKYESVVARLSPDNRVIGAVESGAHAVGIEKVVVVGFRADCSGLAGRVVVCRSKRLDKTGRAQVSRGPADSCVIALDPRLGGGSRGYRVIGSALRRCVR